MGDMAQRGVQVQYHSPCWNAYCGGPSCNTSAPIGSNTTILNKSAVEAALERMIVAPLQHGFLGGVALDECCGGPWLNNGMEQVAKAAYRKARAAFPSMKLHAWTSDPWLIGDLICTLRPLFFNLFEIGFSKPHCPQRCVHPSYATRKK